MGFLLIKMLTFPCCVLGASGRTAESGTSWLEKYLNNRELELLLARKHLEGDHHTELCH